MQVRRSEINRRREDWAMVALIFGLVLVCYWPAMNGAMLWDDPAHVTRPDLRSLTGLGRIWSEVRATQQFYPVLHSAFWLEHRLWGDATLGYHLVNLALHGACCCLLAFLLRRLWSAADNAGGAAVANSNRMPVGVEWVAAVIFAVHPMSVESVAWISEQKNTLSLLFYLLSGMAYLNFNRNRRRSSYAWALLLFLFALGTKSVTATLPAALLVVIWWKQGSVSWRRDVVPLLPWFLVAIVAGLFTAWVERKVIGAEGAQFDFPAIQHLLLAGRVVCFYAAKLLWPLNQLFFYEHWKVGAISAVWLGITGVVTVGLWALRGRCRGLLAGWLLFVGSLFPALGFFNVYPFVFSYVADHFQYLASVSFIATFTGATAMVLSGKGSGMRWVGRGLVGIAVAAMIFFSHQQSRLYVNNETLFRATLARNPDSWMAHHIVAFSLATASGREAEAMAEYEEALRLNPDYPDAHTGLAIELAKIPGGLSEAVRHYERAIELKPNASDAHNNLALVLAGIPGREAEALAHYEAALRIKPDFAEAHANLAIALARMPDRQSDALAHFEAALRLNPNSAEIHDGMASLLAKISSRQAEAIGHWEEALRLKPALAEAHANLAALLAEIPGRIPEAMAHYEEALRLNPDLPEAHYNYANALIGQPGRAADAIAHYQAALQLRPDFAAAHANLGNVLAGLPGRAAEAIEHYESALRTDPGLASVHLALALQLSDVPGREAEAASHAEEALRLKPDYAEAHNCLAIIAAQKGRLDVARRHWETALTLNPDYATARENLRLLDQMQGKR